MKNAGCWRQRTGLDPRECLLLKVQAVLVSRVHVSSQVAYGVAPYQGLCVIALTLKERASERIRNYIPEPLKLKKD